MNMYDISILIRFYVYVECLMYYFILYMYHEELVIKICV